jgi:hypothetical protein
VRADSFGELTTEFAACTRVMNRSKAEDKDYVHTTADEKRMQFLMQILS